MARARKSLALCVHVHNPFYHNIADCSGIPLQVINQTSFLQAYVCHDMITVEKTLMFSTINVTDVYCVITPVTSFKHK